MQNYFLLHSRLAVPLMQDKAEVADSLPLQ